VKHLLLDLAAVCLISAAHLAAQPQIGGGTCSSATLSGTYAVTVTARQLSSSGSLGNALVANGSATFDGQSMVSMNLTSDTNQALGNPLPWSGTYTVQANCTGHIAINTGPTLQIAIYNQGKAFLWNGSDSNYTYAGGGNTQPSTCSAAGLAGVYEFNASGLGLSLTSVNSAGTATGLMQFDGQGNLTANMSAFGPGSSSTTTLTGTYSVSGCQGSATLTDSNSNTFTLNFSVYNQTPVYVSGMYILIARSEHSIMSGSAVASYGQPTSAGGAPTAPPPVMNQIGGGACTAATLSGTYSLSLSGRQISGAGTLTSNFQADGQATFDGVGAVTLSGTANSNLSAGTSLSFPGKYTLSSNCSGTATFSASGGSFTLVVWNNGRSFAVAGADAIFIYSGSGTSELPPGCATSTVSGEYTYQATGVDLSSTVIGLGFEEAGVLQFDGQGKTTGSYTDSVAGMPQSEGSYTGTYAVTDGPVCLATVSITDSVTFETVTFNLVVTGLYGENMTLIGADSQAIGSGSMHSAFTNPSQAITNVASYAYSATPPGSVFALFGVDLASKTAQAASTPLPGTLLSTTVTVNGETAPLFYVGPGQIDAQMPWDIPAGAVATVIVKNGSASSNAVAVYVPATGTPGISVYGNNRAVVVNQDGSVNSGSAPAHDGDEVVVYFTGGGPVDAAGLKAGYPAPSGLSPLAASYSLTVGGIQATVDYIGLTPGSVGLYQANFNVPQLTQGTYPLVITIAGTPSNGPVMTVD